MSGIYGIYNYREAGLGAADIALMANMLQRRGPDQRESYSDEMVMLGHNRLSVMDISPNGRQPMSNESGTILITFDGEIYNFRELRATLKDIHYFKSKTDTEVLIHSYEEMGEDLWKRLEGMFAFCLWDMRRKILYLVRDHFGIKPLYYCWYKGALIFSSQIKGILGIRSFAPNYNYQSISNFLSYFYIPGPETILRDVIHLPPGCFLRKTLDGTGVFPFSHLTFNIDPNLREEQLRDELPLRIRNAVRISTCADVPVGLLLSGGMDSSAILAEMVSVYPRNVNTFTLGVNEPSYDESDYAREVAEKFGATHYIEYLNIEDFDTLLTDMITAVDCLNANPGLINFYQFLRLASRHVKVAISGSGGDELFAGYPTYLADRVHKYLRFSPAFIKKSLLRIVQHLGPSYRKYSYNYVLNKFIEGSFYSREKAHYWWRNILTDEEKTSIFNPDLLKSGLILMDSSYKYVEKFNEVDESFENRALYADFRLFLAENALVMTDHLSMHFSLEVRNPLLYQRFVNYALTIPYHLKFRSGQTKYILRKAYEKNLPQRIVRRKKQGVMAPIGKYFKNNLRHYVIDQLSTDRLKRVDIFNNAYVQNILRNHMEGKEDNGLKLWCLICLMKWNDVFYRRL